MAGNVRQNVGVFVRAIITHPEKSLPGKVVPVAIGYLTYPELLTTWQQATGKKATYVHCTAEEFQGLYPATGLELALQYEFLKNVGTLSVVDPDVVEASDLGVQQDQLVGVSDTLRELSSSWD